MNILILGAGGREHALAWKVSQSRHCTQLFIAPGNAGTCQFGTNLPIQVNDFDAIREHCLGNSVELLIVGPEDPLVNGITDFFANDPELHKIIVVGPPAATAMLEGSKAFAKAFMRRNGIPTAAYREFTLENIGEGKEYLSAHALPVVLKADGLAAGKGVIICNSTSEALEVFSNMLEGAQFGAASSKVVVEAFLEGIEISVFVITDGVDYRIIGHAKDYKRIGEGDTGMNTGGMGCVSPVPFADDAFMKQVIGTIIEPTISGLHKEKMLYNGFVFFGLIKCPAANPGDPGEPYLIEYNCRLGDPETEVLMPRLKNDLVEIFLHMYRHTLPEVHVEYDERAAVTVMAVSGGYPGPYESNLPITNLDLAELSSDTLLFHAGTRLIGQQAVTSGGRVITATALRKTIPGAAAAATGIIDKIGFSGKYFRRDIGYEFTN